MNTAEHRPANRTGPKRWLHMFILVMTMLTHATNDANARASELVPTDYRVSAAGDKFDGVSQYAIAFELRPPRRLRANRLEFAVGSMSTSSEDRAFVSFGPVWRLPVTRRTMFVELGFSPTLIAGSSFNGRDLGGNFHFTSFLAIGATFGRRRTVSVSLRAQHTSNGGLSNTNPGIDMLGINLTFDLTDQ